MSRALTTAAPRPATSSRKVSLAKPQQAGLILTTTAGIICSILFLWLLVAPLIKMPAPLEPIWALALPLPDGLAAPVAFPARDARLLSGADLPAGAVAESARARLERELGGFLDRHPGRPVVLYLSSACDASGGSGEVGLSLLTSGDTLGNADGRVPLDDLIGLLKARGKGSNKLLVLDAGQVGPDRELGLSAPDLPARLKELIGNDPSIAALLASAPGQLSWVAEGRGTSVFAHYLAEALDHRLGRFGRVSAGELLGYVRPRVERWVAEHRGGAVQTPMLIGNAALQVALPRRSPGDRADSKPPGLDPKLLRALLDEWKERRRLASGESTPARTAPIAWRRYQAELLKAERLLRSSSPEAGPALESARRTRRAMERQVVEPLSSRPWSLAVARASKVQDEAAKADAYERNVDRLLALLADPAAQAPDKPKDAAAPKPEDAAKKAEAAEPKDEAPKGDPKPAEPAADADPLESLIDRDPSAVGPLYIEGQVPVWYAQFVERGGETPALREKRIPLVRQAFEVRKLAESSLRDERVARWIRPLIDRADLVRRKAQDLLFSGDETGLKAAQEALAEAEALAGQALRTADACSRALALLDRLQDELPFYGDWLARGRQGLDADYLALLEGAGRLAGLAHAPAGDASATEKARAALVAFADDLGPIEREFRDKVDQAVAKLSTSSDWREIDAILHLPMLDPTTREAMLERVGSESLSPPFDSGDGLSGSAQAAPDPAFWHRAVGLASVEAGLVKVAGIDEPGLGSLVGQAKSNWEKNPDAARSALASISSRARAARARLLADLIEDGNGPDKPRVARVVDRAASVLPIAALKRLALGPNGRFDDPERRDLIAWQGSRLSEDFASREAWDVLTDLRQNAPQSSKDDDLTRAIDLAGARSAARLSLGVGKPDAGQIQVDRGGKLPEGLAVAFVAANPGATGPRVTVRANVDSNLPSPGLFAVPDAKPARLSFEDSRGRPTGLRKPVVFYRGRFFNAEDLGLAAEKEPVTVKIRQRIVEAPIERRTNKGKLISSRKVKVPDQFARNANRGFLHPGTSLFYKLEVMNTSERKLKLFVTHGLDGLKPAVQEVELASGQTSDAVVGVVSSNDLVEGEKLLKVRIAEDDADGRPLAQPLNVPFRNIKPSRDYIKQTVGWSNGFLTLSITHMPDDPVTAPAHIDVRVEPVGAIQQRDTESFDIPLGETASYIYEVTNRTIPKLKWTVFADGEEIINDGFNINDVDAKPIPVAPPPNNPGGGVPPGS